MQGIMERCIASNTMKARLVSRALAQHVPGPFVVVPDAGLVAVYIVLECIDRMLRATTRAMRKTGETIRDKFPMDWSRWDSGTMDNGSHTGKQNGGLMSDLDSL